MGDQKGGSENRREPRAPIELKVDYKKMNSFFADYTKNISKGGTFIKTKKPLPIGTRFLFKLTVPHRESPFELLGEVVWSKPEGDEPGMGIRFIYSTDTQRSDFEGVVETLMSTSLGPELTGKLLNKSLEVVKWGFLLVLLVAACQSAQGANPTLPGAPAQPKAAPTDVTAEDYPMPALPMGRVTLIDAYGGKHVVEVEIAATRDSRTRGLMWRRSLADGKGMLFIFHEQQPLSFWMRNTLIPLDMIFIDKDLKIAGAVERAEPKTLMSRGVGGAQLFVLEVPSGWVAKVGIKAGSTVQDRGRVGPEGRSREGHVRPSGIFGNERTVTVIVPSSTS